MGKFRNADLRDLPSFRLMIGAKPPYSFESNGASRAPDNLFGIDVRPAAHWHDYGYSSMSPGVHNERARYSRDQEFLHNLKLCGLRKLAYVYYFRVRLWGHLHYAYDPGLAPKRTLRFWLNLFFGRYISW